MNPAYSTAKRCFDVVASVTGLIVLSPVIAVTAVLVEVFMGRPVLFIQKRGGKGGQVFDLYKFRTMSNAKDAKGRLLPDEKRLTRLGYFLRRTSLDELPQLWNVLKGDMSVVGPRPWLAEYLERYSTEQARRHEVRPGITGWAQVNGRNAVSWEERFKCDMWYVNHVSFWLDIKIILLTVWCVITGRGLSSRDAETMPLFTGDGVKDDTPSKGEKT